MNDVNNLNNLDTCTSVAPKGQYKAVIIPHKYSCGKLINEGDGDGSFEIYCGDPKNNFNNEFYQCAECRKKDVDEFNALNKSDSSIEGKTVDITGRTGLENKQESSPLSSKLSSENSPVNFQTPTERAEEISRKVTGCERFRTCGWDTFCQSLDLSFQLGQIEGQKQVKSELLEEVGKRLKEEILNALCNMVNGT